MIQRKRFGKVFSLIAAIAMVAVSTVAVAPQQAMALSSKAKMNRVLKGDGAFKKILLEKKESIAEKEVLDVEDYYTFIMDALEDIQDATQTAKKQVPYVLFANLEEKQALYAALSAVIVEIEVYQREVDAIYTQYQQDGDADAAEASFTTLNTAIAAYVDEHKDEFGEQVRAFLIARLEAGLATAQIGLTSLGLAKDAYVTLGEDTTTLVKRLDQAQAAYDEAKERYDTGIASNDTKKLLQSAQWLLAAQVVLLSAQGVVDGLENEVIQ